MVDGSVSFARVLAGLLCVGEAWPKAAVDALGNSVETSDLRFKPTWDQAATGFSVFIAFNPDAIGALGVYFCNLQFAFTFCADSGGCANWGWLARGLLRVLQSVFDAFSFRIINMALLRGAQEVLPGFLVANMQVYPFQGFLAMPISDHVSLWYQCMLSWIINEY